MKLLLLSLLLSISSLFSNNNVLESSYLIPGGENIGINIKSEGILVVGFYKINGNLNKGTPNIKVGDQILEVENIIVNTNEELVETIKNNMHDNKVNIFILKTVHVGYYFAIIPYSKQSTKVNYIETVI